LALPLETLQLQLGRRSTAQRQIIPANRQLYGTNRNAVRKQRQRPTVAKFEESSWQGSERIDSVDALQHIKMPHILPILISDAYYHFGE
jgi:hypothetical protein